MRPKIIIGFLRSLFYKYILKQERIHVAWTKTTENKKFANLNKYSTDTLLLLLMSENTISNNIKVIIELRQVVILLNRINI